jgi:carbon storage regulator CsrA
MLILTRKLTQDVCIGPLVVVRVVAVQDGKVKLGIEAPREVRVLRRELVAAGAVLLTPRERDDEMRDEGSRRFVRHVHEPSPVAA